MYTSGSELEAFSAWQERRIDREGELPVREQRELRQKLQTLPPAHRRVRRPCEGGWGQRWECSWGQMPCRVGRKKGCGSRDPCGIHGAPGLR